MYNKNFCIVFFILFILFENLLGYQRCIKPNIINGDYTVLFKHTKNTTFNHITIEIFKFQCKPNYTLIGMSLNPCIRGKLMYSLPTCQGNILECVTPKVQSGWVECLTYGCNRFYVGTEAAIRCERGYRLLGNSRMHCQAQGEKIPSWSSPLPKCVLIESDDSEQDRQPFNLLHAENSSIMIIIIILSLLAGGLMLIMTIMLMNRLFQRRRLMRIQRSENSSNQPVSSDTHPPDSERNISNFPVAGETPSDLTRWNCFRHLTSRNSRYQHMDTQTPEPHINFEPDYNLADNFEIYSNNIYSDDQTSLIQPPCYEEAVKCSQYSIVASKSLIDQQKLKGSHSKPKSNLPTRSADKEARRSSHRTINSNIPNTSMQSNFSESQNTNENKDFSQPNVVNRIHDVDNISRRSSRTHGPRATNNVTSESNVSFRSGSIETMAISDGTSVTVHTLDSRGSNPSLGSMRPQTGSIGDPTNAFNCPGTQYRHPLALERSATPYTETDSAASEARYSPPPSYECSVNNPVIIRGSRKNHSNTASPGMNVALFVDNMACTEESHDPEEG